jgi:hypothetical protein
MCLSEGGAKSNDFIACNKIDTFIGKVNTYESHGFLLEQQANVLLQQAQAIQDAIGCSVTASNAMQADTAAATPAIHSSLSPDNIPSAMSLRQ